MLNAVQSLQAHALPSVLCTTTDCVAQQHLAMPVADHMSGGSVHFCTVCIALGKVVYALLSENSECSLVKQAYALPSFLCTRTDLMAQHLDMQLHLTRKVAAQISALIASHGAQLQFTLHSDITECCAVTAGTCTAIFPTHHN